MKIWNEITFSFPSSGKITEVFRSEFTAVTDRDGEDAGISRIDTYLGRKVDIDTYLNITVRIVRRPADRYSPEWLAVEIIDHNIGAAAGHICGAVLPEIGKNEIATEFKKLNPRPEADGEWNDNFPEWTVAPVGTEFKWERVKKYID